MDNTFAQLALFFFIYGFLGWCVEVAFAAVKESRFVNRGFLNGPICPIYGFGVVSVVLLLRPLAHSLPLLFLGWKSSFTPDGGTTRPESSTSAATSARCFR